MLDLQEAFKEGSVVCKGCQQSFVNFEKKSQEIEVLGECVRLPLLEALTRTGSPAKPLIELSSPGHTRPLLSGNTSKFSQRETMKTLTSHHQCRYVYMRVCMQK